MANNTIKPALGIPKKMGHIWIGPRPAPFEWLKSWQEHHPDWEYTPYDNNFLESFTFQNIALINEYLKRGQFAGAADLMRYEILYHFGGFLPGADSLCLANTDELFPHPKAYTVYENEKARPGMVSPILACEAGNPFVKQLIEELSKLKPREIGQPWKTTGNRFVAQMIEKCNPEIKIFPSYFFIPNHFSGVTYNGKIYCDQMFGSTTNAYTKGSYTDEIKIKLAKIRGSLLRRLFKKNSLK